MTKAERLARRICRATYDEIGDNRLMWCTLRTIEQRLALTDSKATNAAVVFAVGKDWLAVDTLPAGAVRLKEAGRQMLTF